MITNDIKLKFIELRANNMSMATIAKELNISRGTCSKLEKELRDDITQKQADREAEIAELYTMDRQHRISRLKAILERIDEAIGDSDFSLMSPEALLKMKLRYESELSKELPISDSRRGLGLSDYSYEAVLNKISDLYSDYEAGRISTEQLKSSLSTLDLMIKGISKGSTVWKPIERKKG